MNDFNNFATKFMLSPFVADFSLGSRLELPPDKLQQLIKRTSQQNAFIKSLKIKESTSHAFLSSLERQALAKKSETNGLDNEFHWISIAALILIGCLNCSGTYS